MSPVPKLCYTTLNIKTFPFRFQYKISLEIHPYIWLSNMDFCQLSNYCWSMELPLLSRITMERNLLIWPSTLISKICSNSSIKEIKDIHTVVYSFLTSRFHLMVLQVGFILVISGIFGSFAISGRFAFDLCSFHIVM